MRYLSDDGRCAIDLSLKDGSRGDVGNGVGIYHAARSVLQQCVTTQRGGFATNFSKWDFPYVSHYFAGHGVACNFL